MENTLRLIAMNEGFSQQQYLDTLGNPTIGFGFNLNIPFVKQLVDEFKDSENLISKPNAFEVLNKLVILTQTEAIKAVPNLNKLTSLRRAVVIDMIYNMGLTNFLTFTQTIKAIKKMEFVVASQQMLDSLWALQVKNRAYLDSYLMQYNDWPFYVYENPLFEIPKPIKAQNPETYKGSKSRNL